MNTKNIDFGYLIEQMYMPVGETYAQVLERYEDHPMCLMECIDNGKRSEQIRIDFEKQNASATCFFDKDKVLNLTSLCLHEASDVDLFVVFLLRYADHYDYIKNYWVIKKHFLLTTEQEDYCTHFICRKFVNC